MGSYNAEKKLFFGMEFYIRAETKDRVPSTDFVAFAPSEVYRLEDRESYDGTLHPECGLYTDAPRSQR